MNTPNLDNLVSNDNMFQDCKKEIQALKEENERLTKAVTDMASIVFGPIKPNYARIEIMNIAREALGISQEEK